MYVLVRKWTVGNSHVQCWLSKHFTDENLVLAFVDDCVAWMPKSVFWDSKHIIGLAWMQWLEIFWIWNTSWIIHSNCISQCILWWYSNRTERTRCHWSLLRCGRDAGMWSLMCRDVDVLQGCDHCCAEMWTWCRDAIRGLLPEYLNAMPKIVLVLLTCWFSYISIW